MLVIACTYISIVRLIEQDHNSATCTIAIEHNWSDSKVFKHKAYCKLCTNSRTNQQCCN